MSSETTAPEPSGLPDDDAAISSRLLRYGGQQGFGEIYRKGESTVSQQQPPLSSTPDPFDEYTFLGPQPIGFGGAGDVWLGRTSSGIEVAIKRIPLDQRLGQTELGALEKLKNIRHPHLLPFIHFAKRPRAGSHHEEVLVVMQKADGSLADLLRQGAIAAPVLVEYMQEAAEGLDRLHQKYGYVHRDVKPGNLLLVGESVMVADFGLAKELTDNVATHSRLAMSPPYAPPEWLEPPHTFRASSDQYSLAISYVELRTGRRPFDAHRANQWALERAIRDGLHDLSGLGPIEGQAVRRALAKNPENRYEDCQAFVRALRSALDQDREAATGAVGSPIPPKGEDVPDQGEDVPEAFDQASAAPPQSRQPKPALAPGARGPAMKAIKDLNFGFGDGTEYGRSGEQALLNRFFVRDADVARICAPQITFLVGEKGSGKSMCTEFLSSPEGKSAYGILGKTLTIVAQNYVDVQHTIKSHELPERAYAEIWTTVLLLFLVDHLRRVVPQDQWTPDLKTVSTFIDRFYHGSFSPTVGPTLELIDDAHRAATIVAEIGSINQSFSDSQKLPCILFLQRAFLSAITTMKDTPPVVLFIDGIDVRPDEQNYQEFIKGFAALVNAVWSVNDTVRRSQTPVRSKLVVLVRPDILDKVGLQNLNNKMHDNAVMLDWQTDYENYDHSKLFRMADRMLASQQDGEESSRPTGWWWDKYFPYKAPYRGQFTDHSFIPFLRYSFYRPRDIVTHLREMQRSKVDRDQGTATFFTLADFRDHRVEKEYSRHLLGEVKEGLLFHHPAAQFELFLMFFTTYLRPFMDERPVYGEPNRFGYQTFLRAYDEFRRYLNSNGLSPGVIFQTADILLQFLYELNIICYLEDLPSRARPRYHWCFRERSYANIRPKVRPRQTYMIHYGIAEALKQA